MFLYITLNIMYNDILYTFIITYYIQYINNINNKLYAINYKFILKIKFSFMYVFNIIIL